MTYRKNSGASVHTSGHIIMTKQTLITLSSETLFDLPTQQIRNYFSYLKSHYGLLSIYLSKSLKYGQKIAQRDLKMGLSSAETTSCFQVGAHANLVSCSATEPRKQTQILPQTTHQ